MYIFTLLVFKLLSWVRITSELTGRSDQHQPCRTEQVKEHPDASGVRSNDVELGGALVVNSCKNIPWDVFLLRDVKHWVAVMAAVNCHH